MNKPQSYNLSLENISRIKELAKEKKWSASLWLDDHLTEVFLPNLMMQRGLVTESQWTNKEKAMVKASKNNDEFDLVWAMYGKKGNRKTSLAKFNKMKDSSKKLMAHHLPRYIDSTPDKQFRKNLETYINQECWNDEVIEKLSKLEAVGDDRSYMLEEFK